VVNKIKEVLEIETADSYTKRSTGPMITIEVGDISKLAGFFRILSMAKGASTTNTTAQKISTLDSRISVENLADSVTTPGPALSPEP